MNATKEEFIQKRINEKRKCIEERQAKEMEEILSDTRTRAEKEWDIESAASLFITDYMKKGQDRIMSLSLPRDSKELDNSTKKAIELANQKKMSIWYQMNKLECDFNQNMEEKWSNIWREMENDNKKILKKYYLEMEPNMLEFVNLMPQGFQYEFYDNPKILFWKEFSKKHKNLINLKRSRYLDIMGEKWYLVKL